MHHTLITYYDEIWLAEPSVDQRFVDGILTSTISGFAEFHSIKHLELELILANNSFIKKLNHKFLHKNAATNVLAFPKLALNADNFSEVLSQNRNNKLHLGEIVLSYSFTASEAKRKKLEFRKHFAHLMVHGILHLLGFDHSNSREEQEMRKLETQILNSIFNK